MDVRISVTQTSREISLELADDLDRLADFLIDTDPVAAKIAFVELGAAEGERRIGFGG